MTPPAFWQTDGLIPHLLSPASAMVAAFTARRVARPGWRAPVPVICCGNVGVGGAGKTTVALDLGRRVPAAAFLSRGYGGQMRQTLRVDLSHHTAALVGDEPLLLAAVAPTWVGPDRAESARAAIAAGMAALIMDDGLQNPGLDKTASLLVVDGAVGFGNGRVLPAGPLRETVAAAVARCRAAVMIGPDRTGAGARLGGIPILRADLVPDRDLTGRRVFGFCGIGRPDKFRDSLHKAGAEMVGWSPFPDHHPFSAAELTRILAAAERAGAVPVTTAKDAVRLTPEMRARVEILGVRLAWHDEAWLTALVAEWLT